MNHVLARITNRVMGIISSMPFRFGIYGGIAGVLVDLDHFIPLWTSWKAERPLHISLLIISSIIFIYCCSRIGRLLSKDILNNGR